MRLVKLGACYNAHVVEMAEKGGHNAIVTRLAVLGGSYAIVMCCLVVVAICCCCKPMRHVARARSRVHSPVAFIPCGMAVLCG